MRLVGLPELVLELGRPAGWERAAGSAPVTARAVFVSGAVVCFLDFWKSKECLRKSGRYLCIAKGNRHAWSNDYNMEQEGTG